MSGPTVNDDGSITLRSRLTIPAEDIDLRVTTSGGPGGQHANRSLTRRRGDVSRRGFVDPFDGSATRNRRVGSGGALERESPPIP